MQLHQFIDQLHFLSNDQFTELQSSSKGQSIQGSLLDQSSSAVAMDDFMVKLKSSRIKLPSSLQQFFLSWQQNHFINTSTFGHFYKKSLSLNHH